LDDSSELNPSRRKFDEEENHETLEPVKSPDLDRKKSVAAI
jgi:hypothetical protein